MTMTRSEVLSGGGDVKERPILFSSPMVQGILAGRKNMTRRVICCACNTVHPDSSNPGKLLGAWALSDPPYRWDGSSRLYRLRGPRPKAGDWIEEYQTDVDDNATARVICPYGEPGDRLWVRETWAQGKPLSDGSPSCQVAYKADGIAGAWDGGRLFIHHGYIQGFADTSLSGCWMGLGRYGGKWRPSIFMPRWASRITLEVTGVRVERVQEITEADAMGEGFAPWTHRTEGEITGRRQFLELWDKINGKRSGCDWGTNPWVWCVSFQRIEA